MAKNIEKNTLKYDEMASKKYSYEKQFEFIDDHLYKYHNIKTNENGIAAFFGTVRGADDFSLFPLCEVTSPLTDEQLDVTFSTRSFSSVHEEFTYDHGENKFLYEKLLDRADYLMYYIVYGTHSSFETLVPIRYKKALKKHLLERCSVCFSTSNRKTIAYAMIRRKNMDFIMETGKTPMFAESFIASNPPEILEWGKFIMVEKDIPEYPEIIDVLNNIYTESPENRNSAEEYIISKVLSLSSYIIYDNKNRETSVKRDQHIKEILNYRIEPLFIYERDDFLRIGYRGDEKLSVYEYLQKGLRYFIRYKLQKKFMSYFPTTEIARQYLKKLYNCDYFDKMKKYPIKYYSIAEQLYSLFAGKLVCDTTSVLDLPFVKNDLTIRELSELNTRDNFRF